MNAARRTYSINSPHALVMLVADQDRLLAPWRNHAPLSASLKLTEGPACARSWTVYRLRAFGILASPGTNMQVCPQAPIDSRGSSHRYCHYPNFHRVGSATPVRDIESHTICRS